MHDHFKPPEHFTYWQGIGFRVLCLVTFVAVMTLVALYVMPWVGAHYFDPFTDWFTPRFFALFGEHENFAAAAGLAIIALPWAAMHIWLSYDARKKRNREKASADASQ